MAKRLALLISGLLVCSSALGFSLTNKTEYVVHAAILTSSKTWTLHDFDVAPGETRTLNLKKAYDDTVFLRYISVSNNKFFYYQKSTWRDECDPKENLVVSYINKFFVLEKLNESK